MKTCLTLHAVILILLAGMGQAQETRLAAKKNKNSINQVAGDRNETTAARLHRPLPESLTSFGAAVQDDYLYVFSGHSGVAHGFGKDLLVDHFRRIRFDDPQAEWEELAMHEPAQSVALVSDGEFLYRLAGLSFLNSGEDSKTNFQSTTHFARYSVADNEWKEMTPLPQPRSSLDAAVLGRSIYVAGGWNLQGESSREAPWHEDVLRFDLDNPELGWQSIEGPGYKTRALSVAAHDGKLFLIGGIQDRGITKKVSILNPQTNQWSAGPDLPSDSSTAGFATSAFAVGGQLYCTGGSGVVYRLSADNSSWKNVDRLLFPRMFLRLLPVGNDRLIALGGTGSVGRTSVVESLCVGAGKSTESKMASWSVNFGGRAKHSQTLLLDRGKLYAFGGNASREAHDFSNDAFVDEAFVFDLGDQSVEALPTMPAAMQSGVALINAQTSEHKALVVAGGLGPGEERMAYLSSVYSYDPEEKAWSVSDQSLPEPRAMYNSVVHDDAIWMFAGSGDRGQGLAHSILHWWGDESGIAPLASVAIPKPRRSCSGAMLDGRYYIIGGLASGMEIAEQVDVFDFESRMWSQIDPPAVPRVFPSLAATQDKLYLFGGFTNTTGHFAPATSLEVYDLKSGKWETLAESLPGVPASMSMLSFNNRLLFYGIDEDLDGQANFVLFDPEPMSVPKTVESMSFSSSQGRRDDSEETAKMMIRKDVNKDGKLSKAELGKRLASLIESGDSDGDGLLSLVEAKVVLKAQAEAEQAAAEAAEEPAEQADESDSEQQPAKDETAVTSDVSTELQSIADRAQRAADAAQRAADKAQRLADEAQRKADSAKRQ